MNKVFISYSGSRFDRAALFYALRDYGLNPWRDVESLELGGDSTEVIEAELAQCSAAILWINPDIFGSAYVADVELPAIVKAWQQGNLRIVPVFDGMSPEEASAEVSRRFGVEVGDINGDVIDSNPSTEDNAARIAARLVRAHVQDAHRNGEPPIVRLVSYDDTAGLRERAVLNLDWRHRLTRGGLEPSDEGRLRAALTVGIGALKEAYGACEVILAVKAHLPLAVALGHAFARPTGCTIRLYREDDDDRVAPAVLTGENGLIPGEALKGPVETRVSSLEISISRDVEAGVQAYVRQGNRYRHRRTLKPAGGASRRAVDGSDTASSWARQIGTELAALADQSDVDRVDLFMAAPVEVAVLTGSCANAVGEVQLMDWGKTGPFSRMWSLP